MRACGPDALRGAGQTQGQVSVASSVSVRAPWFRFRRLSRIAALDEHEIGRRQDKTPSATELKPRATICAREVAE